jgi:oligopeptide transport system ATP-binding protein
MSDDKRDDVLLKVENLSMFFGKGDMVKKAVNDVSFEVRKGEVFGLVGESGCGKTTTGRTIIKLYDATSGNVWFGGKRIVAGTKSYYDEIKAQKARRKELVKNGGTQEQIAACDEKIAEMRAEIRKAKYDHNHCDDDYRKDEKKRIEEKYQELLKDAAPEEEAKLRKQMRRELRVAAHSKLVTQIQMIYQDPVASLDPRMTVREIISEGLIIQGIRDKKYLQDQVYEMLDTVGLVHEHADRYPHEFSGGQRQRIGIARSVVMKPKLIIADEPISALDVSIRAQVINLLNELRETMGMTILFIAHDLSVVKYFSDRIGVMYFGNLVEMTDSDELFRHPLHPYTRSLLSAIPLPDPDTEKNRVRIRYNPLLDHEKTDEEPQLREVCPGHFVRCTEKEFLAYRKQVSE